MAKRIFKRLAYIYIGTTNYYADYNYYKNVLGAKRVWEFQKSGVRTAAFDLTGEPFILLGEYIHHASKRLIYQVENLEDAVKTLGERGWQPDGEKFELADGMCCNFKDTTGNEFAMIEVTGIHDLEKIFKETDE